MIAVTANLRRTKLIAAVVLWFGVAAPLAFGQTAEIPATRRLYVEPFTTKSGAEKLRDDVVAELGKLKSISLVQTSSGADMTLGGGGEIWIRGSRDFWQPHPHRVNSITSSSIRHPPGTR